jgi:hypothetical protein
LPDSGCASTANARRRANSGPDHWRQLGVHHSEIQATNPTGLAPTSNLRRPIRTLTGVSSCPAPPSSSARATAASSIATSRRPPATARCRRSCSRPPSTASTRTSARSPTSLRRTATSRPRPICSGAPCRVRCRTRTNVRPSVRSRVSRRSRPARPTWRIRSPTCARCRNSTAVPRRWASATAAPTRSSVPSGWATTPASPATARGCWTSSASSTASRNPLHHVGRTGPRRAGRVLEAYRAVPARMPNAEVHIFPGVLHGYMMPGNVKAFHPETRAFSMARAFAILDGLRAESGRQKLRQAS